MDVCGIFTDREDSEPHQNGPKRDIYLGAPKPMSGSWQHENARDCKEEIIQ